MEKDTLAFPDYTDRSVLANEIGNFFAQKILRIRNELDTMEDTTNGHAEITSVAPSFHSFNLLTEDDVHKLITSSKATTCCLDPIPTSVLLSCIDPLLPVITNIINTSLESGCFPEAWKEAVIRPLLKKAGLDCAFKNLRPVSNLAYVSKLTERAVFNQTHDHFVRSGLYPLLQSAYRQHHSTETALLKVANDILLNMNSQRVTLLVLLDLSAAFDTVDHEILLQRLRRKFGVGGRVLDWLTSYLSGRSQRVLIDGASSERFNLRFGVPQGSCLGPLLFTAYVSELFEIIKVHLPEAHCFADDVQLYLSFKPGSSLNQAEAIQAMENCITDLRKWMFRNKLKFNDDKTDFLIMGSRQQLAKLNPCIIRVGSTDIQPVSSLRNLGSWFDQNLSMSVHVSKTCGVGFFWLHNIKRISKFLPRDRLETVIHAFITSRVDYCNGLLYGLPKYELAKLQRVQNAAARLLTCIRRYDHITPVLRALHWLPISYRIQFKILLLTFKALHGMAPDYIRDLITIRQHSRYSLRSSSSIVLEFPQGKMLRSFGDRAFSVAAPKLWNALPLDLRNISSLSTFKSCLKLHLFKSAFSL